MSAKEIEMRGKGERRLEARPGRGLKLWDEPDDETLAFLHRFHDEIKPLAEQGTDR